MKYVIDGIEYEVVIEKKKNKNTYIRVKEDLKIYVSTNYLASKLYVKALLKQNEKSIKRMIESVNKKVAKKELFLYLGVKYDIIRVSSIDKVDKDDINHIIYTKDENMLEKWFLKETKKVFNENFVEIFSNFEECDQIPTLKLRKMKTRWGVYNRANHSVTLNTELMKYDIEDLRYVIVHELCHIVNFDHSKKFWALVSKYFKDYKKCRKDLKE